MKPRAPLNSKNLLDINQACSCLSQVLSHATYPISSLLISGNIFQVLPRNRNAITTYCRFAGDLRIALSYDDDKLLL